MYFCTRKLDKRSVAKLKGSGLSAVGSAHVWGARGRWFESSNPDQKKKAENQEILGLFLFIGFLKVALGDVMGDFLTGHIQQLRDNDKVGNQ